MEADVTARPVDAVRALLGGRAPACGRTRVVAVDGPSGSGKTTLADRLADALGAPVVRMDDLYPGWDGLEAAVPLLDAAVLAPLALTGHARYRTWDWARSRWGEHRDLDDPRVLVVDGVGSSAGAAARRLTVAVWVEADREVRFERGMTRDGEAYRPHWARWARQEDALFAADRTRERADVVLDTTAWAPGAADPHPAGSRSGERARP